MYMDIPRGCNVAETRNKYALKLEKNLYGTKQAGRMWYLHLRKGLRKRGFKQSRVDDCIFYKSSTIFIVYVDDAIFIGPDENEINNMITDLKALILHLMDMILVNQKLLMI